MCVLYKGVEFCGLKSFVNLVGVLRMAAYYNILGDDADGSVRDANLRHFDNDGMFPGEVVLRPEFDERTQFEREMDEILGGGLDGRVDDVEWAVTITTNEAVMSVAIQKLETLLFEWVTYLSLRIPSWSQVIYGA